jgi:CRISPR-associated endonuclease/helicase Cas3
MERAGEAGYVRFLREAADGPFCIDRYADGIGIAITARKNDTTDESTPGDDGDDSLSQRADGGRISLDAHTGHVAAEVRETCSVIPTADYSKVLEAAARMHDWGKADPRFQAMLIRGDVFTALMQPRLWAKSGDAFTSRRDSEIVRSRAELPIGFRHELLSVQLAGTKLDESDEKTRDIVLHLIASHHGYARPFPPVCLEREPTDIRFEANGRSIELPARWRLDHPPDRLDSGIAQRFWTATRTLGWWAVCYLEAVLRLADQAASRHPSETVVKAEQREEAIV